MIDHELYAIYETALETNLALMQESFGRLPEQLEQFTESEKRKLLGATYVKLVRRHGSFAAVSAVEFYDELRSLSQVNQPYEAAVFYPDNYGLLLYDAAKAAEAVDIEKSIGKMMSVGTQRVMEYADETLWENAKSDPARPKWALVPHPGACAWCQLIASNGFMYTHAMAVENTRHPNCRCRPVVDFDTENPRLEGYDPDALYERYAKARDEVDKTAWDEWQELTPERQAEYGGKRRGDYDHFKRNKIIAAMSKQ